VITVYRTDGHWDGIRSVIGWVERGMGVGCGDQADGEKRSRKEDYTTSNHHWTQNQTADTRKYIHTPYSSGAPLLREEEESYLGQCSH